MALLRVSALCTVHPGVLRQSRPLVELRDHVDQGRPTLNSAAGLRKIFGDEGLRGNKKVVWHMGKKDFLRDILGGSTPTARDNHRPGSKPTHPPATVPTVARPSAASAASKTSSTATARPDVVSRDSPLKPSPLQAAPSGTPASNPANEVTLPIPDDELAEIRKLTMPLLNIAGECIQMNVSVYYIDRTGQWSLQIGYDNRDTWLKWHSDKGLFTLRKGDTTQEYKLGDRVPLSCVNDRYSVGFILNPDLRIFLKAEGAELLKKYY